MTTYFGKTGGSCFRERSPPSRRVDGHVIRSVIISWRRNIRVHARQRPPKMECEKNLILGTMDKSEILVLTGVDRLKQEGIMMNSTRWMQRVVLCGLLLTGLVGCSMIANPPVGQISQNDHAALATWYDKEAAQLRQKAEDMADMEAAYAKNPAYGQSIMAGIGKENFNQRCDALKAMYTKGAEEADQLAKKHRSMVK